MLMSRFCVPFIQFSFCKQYGNSAIDIVKVVQNNDRIFAKKFLLRN
jgi:hypothetical protein